MGADQRGASLLENQNISSRVSAAGQLHLQGLVSGLGRLARTPFSTTMAVIVIAIALSLPAVFFVLVDNVQTVSEKITVSNQISLFLKSGTDDKKSVRIAENIRNNPDIGSVTVISRQAALQEFKQHSGFSGALDILEYNPLPIVIQVQPVETIVDPVALRELTKKLENNAAVDFVQFDMQWVRRLRSITGIIKRGVVIVSVLLSVGVVFVVSNTIRLELRSRHDEIIVMKLLGATDSFIRRPFLYGGFWYGFLGGCLACLIVVTALFVFEGPVNRLSMLYEADYQLKYLGTVRTFYLLVFSSFLGVTGAWMVLINQLYRMNPR